MTNFAALNTELRNADTQDIDVVSTVDMCRIINREDAKVADAVSKCIPVIAKIIDELAVRVRRGGRVVYVGAGTSGRLGVLDASEMPPTFSAPYGQFIGMIAGGDHAIRHAAEGAEDSLTIPVHDLDALDPPLDSQLDTVIGLAASGRTPYVIAALKHARSLGCFTAGICCVDNSELRGAAQEVVECAVGAEVVTGSTRMKSGTAQKLILNMISTGCQIRIGKTYGNLMVDMKQSNIKLVDRSRRIFRAIVATIPHDLDIEQDQMVDELMRSNGGSVKQAIVAARWSCTPVQAAERLAATAGMLKPALQ